MPPPHVHSECPYDLFPTVHRELAAMCEQAGSAVIGLNTNDGSLDEGILKDLEEQGNKPPDVHQTTDDAGSFIGAFFMLDGNEKHCTLVHKNNLCVSDISLLEHPCGKLWRKKVLIKASHKVQCKLGGGSVTVARVSGLTVAETGEDIHHMVANGWPHVTLAVNQCQPRLSALVLEATELLLENSDRPKDTDEDGKPALWPLAEVSMKHADMELTITPCKECWEARVDLN
eukprot:TRINITY_DN60249_c0_g1_i2.p2 TRINITY_DN60249_c0_g1~~TRINITY_DN60249_c0_g1_i2.p2  ORF type:complete len:230 (+),score=32.40 TRINITY_DN60249_c0_g1_i2:71-760(+)